MDGIQLFIAGMITGVGFVLLIVSIPEHILERIFERRISKIK